MKNRHCLFVCLSGRPLKGEVGVPWHLTGLDTNSQAQTQQKKILVFEFVASYELTIDKDSLDTQIFHPCPPLGIGHPIFG